MMLNFGVKPRGRLLQSFTPQITYQGGGGGATSYRKIDDRVQETTTTTGTGTYTLSGAKDGFQSFAAVGDAAETYYCCTDGTDYEVGIGTYTLSGTTLARTTIIESSNSNAAVNWGSGDKDIFVTLPASRAVAQGVSLYQDNSFTNPLQPAEVPTASSSDSVAIGRSAAATAINAYAIGTLTDALQAESLAIGYSAQSNGQFAAAISRSYASGADSFAAAIATNQSSYGASGANSIAMGYQAKAGFIYSIAIGAANDAGAGRSLAIGGYGNVVGGTGSYSVICGGRENETANSYSFASGAYAKADIEGKLARASGRFAATGDAQGGQFILRADTTDATATVLTTNNSTAGSTNQIVAASDTCITFDGTITAMQNGAQAYASWKIEGLLVNDGGTTTLANSATTVIQNLSSWGMALSADNTNNALAITVTGEAAHNIRWVANIRTTEVTYA